MRKVATVLGDVDANSLGDVLCHEHVICADPSMRAGFGDNWFPLKEVEERAVTMFSRAYDCGIRTVIDGSPLNLGRDIGLMRRVSQKSGVNLIASSGMYYCEEVFVSNKKPENFAQFFIRECREGIFGTDVRPGMLKCATGSNGVTPINRILLTAMAITQRETGLPMFAHNEHAQKTPYEQIAIFKAHGVNLEQVVIGHSSDSRDVDYLEDLLRYGCYLGFDRINPFLCDVQAKVMAELIRRGWEDKLLVSHDCYAFIDFGDTDWERQAKESADGRLTTVHRRLFPALRELGVSERQIQKLVRDNPARLLCER